MRGSVAGQVALVAALLASATAAAQAAASAQAAPPAAQATPATQATTAAQATGAAQATPAAPATAAPQATGAASDRPFRCDAGSDRAVPRLAACDDRACWDEAAEALRASDPARHEQTVCDLATACTNLGGQWFDLPDGSRKVVYRSSFLAKAPSCLTALVRDGGVRTMVNLYSGSMEAWKSLAAQERDLFVSAGGHAYVQVIGYDYRMAARDRAALDERISEIVRMVVAAPGNVLIHCFGGMHRTGIVYGVMQKCLNRTPIERVIDEYRCHTAFEAPGRPGGALNENEEVIREFPCERLVPAPRPANATSSSHGTFQGLPRGYLFTSESGSLKYRYRTCTYPGLCSWSAPVTIYSVTNGASAVVHDGVLWVLSAFTRSCLHPCLDDQWTPYVEFDGTPEPLARWIYLFPEDSHLYRADYVEQDAPDPALMTWRWKNSE